MSDYTPEQKAAWEKVLQAAEEWGKVAPPSKPPSTPLRIEPTLLHAMPSNFHLGYNMLLDAGGYMPGKIPVMVIPIRPEDIKRYKQSTTVNALWHKLGFPK